MSRRSCSGAPAGTAPAISGACGALAHDVIYRQLRLPTGAESLAMRSGSETTISARQGPKLRRGVTVQINSEGYALLVMDNKTLIT